MHRYPMAFHITWGTKDARLHGSSKPHVDRDHNEYGTPFAPTDPTREGESRARMNGDPVSLSPDQRKTVHDAIHDVARRYGWTIHSVAVQSDHVHVVITAFREGEELRDALKAVGSRALNKRFEKRDWWAEKGSAKYLWERNYFENARDYVGGQRDF
jgi:REP element-mobilizing transposase RayT